MHGRQAQGSQAHTNRTPPFNAGHYQARAGDTLRKVAEKFHMFHPTGNPIEDNRHMKEAVARLLEANPQLKSHDPDASIEPDTILNIPEQGV